MYGGLSLSIFVREWLIVTGRMLIVLTGIHKFSTDKFFTWQCSRSITALAFSRLGLVSASRDYTAHLWDVASGVIIRRFNHPKGDHNLQLWFVGFIFLFLRRIIYIYFLIFCLDAKKLVLIQKLKFSLETHFSPSLKTSYRWNLGNWFWKILNLTWDENLKDSLICSLCSALTTMWRMF